MTKKAKTRKAAAKRFKVTKSGKVLYRQQGFRHLRSKKSKTWLRRKKRTKQLKGRLKQKVLKMLAKK